jgi:hypothetical protein
MYELGGSGPIAVCPDPETPLMAAAAKTRVAIFRGDLTFEVVDVPARFPAADHDFTATQRMITAMCWVPDVGGPNHLVFATAGGMVYAVRVDAGHVVGMRGLVRDMGVILTLTPVAGEKPAVLVGDTAMAVSSSSTASPVNSKQTSRATTPAFRAPRSSTTAPAAA